MLQDTQRTEERLFSICATMRSVVDTSIRDGMMRAIPDPMEARQLADVYARLLHRIRAVEQALNDFRTDLHRAQELFERAERRANGPTFLITEDLDEIKEAKVS